MREEKWARRLEDYEAELRRSGKAQNTVRKYVADARAFLAFAAEHAEEEGLGRDYAAFLRGKYKSATCNSYLISVNKFLSYLGEGELRIPLQRIQSRFSLESELTLEEYHRLLSGFRRAGDPTYALIARTLTGMGLRVGELPFITPQALQSGWAEVVMKGKARQLFFPQRLRQELGDYGRRAHILSGPIFLNRRGDGPVDSSLVWRHLQRAAELGGVSREKAFPHNLRHLFARVYMDTYQDIVDLADILGHSSIETTRIYTRTSSAEKIRRISALTL